MGAFRVAGNATFAAVALLVAGCALIGGAVWRSPEARRLAADEPIQLGRHPSPERLRFGDDGRVLLVSRDGDEVRIESCDADGGACRSARVSLGRSAGGPFDVHAGASVTTVVHVDGDARRRLCVVELRDGLRVAREPRCAEVAAGPPLVGLALVDGRRAVVAREGGDLRFLDLQDPTHDEPSGTRLRGDWSLSAAGRRVLAADLASGNFAVLETGDDERERAAFYVCPEGSRPTVLGVLPSGEPVVGTADGSVLYPRGEAWVPLGPLPGAVRALAVRADGRVLVAGEFDGVRVVSPERPEPRPLLGRLAGVSTLATGDGHLALARGGPVTVYRVTSRLVTSRLAGHPLVWTGLLAVGIAIAIAAAQRLRDRRLAPTPVIAEAEADAAADRPPVPSRAAVTPRPPPAPLEAEFRSVDGPPWAPPSAASRGAASNEDELTVTLEPDPGRELAVGERLGSYEIRALLGSGAMGHVYEAYDRAIGRTVAIKVLAPRIAGDPQALARFRSEARALGAVSHANVLGIHMIGEERGTVFVVMERLEGETLRERLERGELAALEARRIAIAIARGLAAAHARGLVHRDIKPDNVFLARDGVKILDFGLARAFVADGDETPGREGRPTVTRMTSPGAMVGTFGYMSPEQAVGDPLDGRSDLFALGCVMYEMLAGEGPYERERRHESLAALLRDSAPSIVHRGDPLSLRLSEIVARLLEREPRARFQTAEAVIDALERTRKGQQGQQGDVY